MTVEWLTGDALEQVRALPDNSVDLVATSPPFLALRNYNDLPGQWGSEPTPAAFLDNLLLLTAELRRVLTPTGSIAIELGDTYSGSGNGPDALKPENNGAHDLSRDDMVPRRGGHGWPLAKSLTGIPTLYAWSLAYGHNLLGGTTLEPWRIRNIIVWARNNPPVGALGDKYRPATSYITVATPSSKRWFDLDAVRVPHSSREHFGQLGGRKSPKGGDWTRDQASGFNPAGAPPLDHWHDPHDGNTTWLINTQGSGLAHYAMWPARLAERLIVSMCPPGGHVLDPFCGSGTTLAVADIHDRDATGIDLDPHNPDLYQARYAEVWRALKPDAGPSPVTKYGTQLGIFGGDDAA